MMPIRSGEVLLLSSIAAVAAVVAWHVIPDLMAAPEPAGEPFGPATPAHDPVRPDREPACAVDPYFIAAGLTKEVATPDVSLSSAEGMALIHAGHDWFVVNVGTSEHPLYRLGRVYPDGTLKLGQLVPDLALLGPSSIPEVQLSELTQEGDRFTLSQQNVSESEMSEFYKIEDTRQSLPAGYESGLARRAQSYNAPVEAGDRPVSDDSIRTVRDTVFDGVDYSKGPLADGADGPCRKTYFAEAKVHNASLVTNEYLLLLNSDRTVQSWVRAHELGHALMKVVGGADAFNALPSDERRAVLEELKNFITALDATHKQHSYDTANESVADLFSYLLRDPAFTKAHAPKSAKFFGDLINAHPELNKILHFK